MASCCNSYLLCFKAQKNSSVDRQNAAFSHLDANGGQVQQEPRNITTQPFRPLTCYFVNSLPSSLFLILTLPAPETIFFVTALLSNNTEFAVGAVSGSAIVVTTVALGACVYIGSNARAHGNFYLQPGVRHQCFILGMLSVSVWLFVWWR